MANYLIIGSGRTARHFIHYFRSLGLPFETWNRQETPDKLQSQLQKASHILILIPDSAIAGFFEENLKQQTGRTFVHFSGASEVPGIHSAHPLMTFTEELYDLSLYPEIPFVLTSKKEFRELLPGLPNKSFQISPEQKPLYHALCVLSGNFTTLLWQKMASGMKSLGLPEDISKPYMTQIFKNLQTQPTGALTGPLARKDLKTVMANHRALNGDPAQKIYRAFVEVYYPEALKNLEGGA